MTGTKNIGPKRAVFDAPAARSDPPPPKFQLKTIHVLAVLVVLGALAVPIYLAFTNPSIQSAGISGFVGIFFGCLSILLCLWRVLLSRLRPQAQALPALAAAFAVVGLAACVLGANAGYDAAFELVTSDHALSAADRDAQVGALTVAARTTARLGFTTLPGFAFAFLLLLGVIRARRVATPMVPGAPGPVALPTGPAFASLFAAGISFLVALVFALRAAF